MKVVIVLLCVALTYAKATFGQSVADLISAAKLAGSASPDVSDTAFATLRNAGPVGLEALLNEWDRAQDASLLPKIDAVAGQLHADYSRLYWYTDLARAQSVAAAQNKPVLYLRMLGKLTDEYSCANSRFFRTILYSNARISNYLRQNYVLYWCSERPVPQVTIDYGDGRTMKRTLTGNSIHYVLNAKGDVIDAMPGVFSPARFLALIQSDREASLTGSAAVGRAEESLLQNWKTDLGHVDPALLKSDLLAALNGDRGAPAAMRMTVGKSLVEMPLLRKVAPQFAAGIDHSIDDANAKTWDEIAALHASDAELDASSISLMRSQNSRLRNDPAALADAVSGFEKLIALDSVRNDYRLRRLILGWLRAAESPIQLDELNRRVYSELFLTPRSDPWLGLESTTMYTALPDDGLTLGAASLASN